MPNSEMKDDKGGLKPVAISVRGIDRDSFEEVLLFV